MLNNNRGAKIDKFMNWVLANLKDDIIFGDNTANIDCNKS